MSSSITRLESVAAYYTAVCFGPLPSPLITKPYFRIIIIFLYIISRLCGIAKFTYEFLLAIGTFREKHGDLDIYGYIEAALWACGMLPYVACDILFLSPEFLVNVQKLFAVMKSIFADTLHNTSWTSSARTAASKTFRFMAFSSTLDWFQNVFTFFALQGTMSEQSNLYSVLPWQSPAVENLAWVLESFNLAALFMAISMMTTLPGIYAFYLEECLRRMTDFVNNAKRDDEVWKMMKNYRDLFFITREFNKRMAWGAMSFISTNGVQQTAETYCVFQLMRAGANFEEYQFLLIDLFTSASRVGYGFHAMSVVDPSAEEFLSSVKLYLARSRKGHKHNRKLIRGTLRSYKKIHMSLGKSRCSSSFFLDGMSVYLNNYFTAALWP